MPRFLKTNPDQPLLFEMPDNSARAARKPPQPLTSAQQLGSIVKSARDIMRKEQRIAELMAEIKVVLMEADR